MHKPSRRTLLTASAAAVGAGILTACTGGSHQQPRPHAGPAGLTDGLDFVPPGPKGYVNPSGPEVHAAERKRGSGPVRMLRFTAAETMLDLGGRTMQSWAYNETVP